MKKSALEAARASLELESRAVLLMKDCVESEAFARAVDLIAHAPRVMTCASGTSGTIFTICYSKSCFCAIAESNCVGINQAITACFADTCNTNTGITLITFFAWNALFTLWTFFWRTRSKSHE